MSGPEALSRLVAAIGPLDLLPSRRSDESQRVEAPVDVRGSAWLDDAHGITVVRDARGVDYGVPVAVDGGQARRAAAGDGTAEALLRVLADGGSSALDLEVFHVEEARGEVPVEVDQTNDLVVVGGRAVVKWSLHPEPEPAPGPSRLAALARAGFAGTPRTWALVHLRVGEERVLVATVSEYLPGAVDGWDWAVDDVRALASGEMRDTDEAVDQVGALVGALHVALASEGIGRADQADAERWLGQARQDAHGAALPDALSPRVDAELAPIGECAGTPVIPVHGDLHIGQVLRVPGPLRYVVIDFDGNPTQAWAERMSPQPAARDVAGMLASLDHVGRVVLHRTADLDQAARARVTRWIEEAQAGFLRAYERALADAGLSLLLDHRLLRAMQVQQECREYVYAARYLPHWRYVPDAALPALLQRPASQEP